MDIYKNVESAEKQFRQILESYFITIYDDTYLASHGIDHHRRVWNYAKEILDLQPSVNANYDANFTLKLIISCYFHDIGMSVDTSIRHGKFSRAMCATFLKKNGFKESDFIDVLSVIEEHDNKDYSTSDNEDELFTLLSVADDLDAFGVTGIYRYFEIYLERGINPANLGYMVLKNAGSRFQNFSDKYSTYKDFFTRHELRYRILTDFFSKYNEQIKGYAFLTGQPEGYCGVAEIIHNMLTNKSDIKTIIKRHTYYSYDSVISWFLRSLDDEMLQ
jgi:hypothetical protein